jgi:hypothetical protein
MDPQPLHPAVSAATIVLLALAVLGSFVASGALS